jgi:hypothetical protein
VSDTVGTGHRLRIARGIVDGVATFVIVTWGWSAVRERLPDPWNWLLPALTFPALVLGWLLLILRARRRRKQPGSAANDP